MSVIYRCIVTDANGNNPVGKMIGVPSGGYNQVCSGWGSGPTGPNFPLLDQQLHEHYPGPTNIPPHVDFNTTLLFTHENYNGYTDVGSNFAVAHGVTFSSLAVEDGTTKIVWFTDKLAEVGGNDTKNVTISWSQSLFRFTFVFRIGTTSYFQYIKQNNVCIFPWFYDNIVINNIKGQFGSCQFYLYGDDSGQSLTMPNGQGIPSYGAMAITSTMDAWRDGLPLPADPDNPYDNGGTTGEGGGDPANQNFDGESDTVEEDTLPSISSVGTGFATIFTPNALQLQNLSGIFWGDQWWQALQNTVEGLDKMFVSLGMVPFLVTPGQTVEVTWLNLHITEVYLTLAAWQYKEFDMGTIDLSDDSRIWTTDSAMDYSPFCKLGIYLPFIGFQELDIDECRGKTIQLIYRVDIMSGACIALVKINGNTLYQFTGNCMTQIPLTSQSFENLYTNVVNVGLAAANAKTAGAIAGGGDAVTAEQWDADKITEAQAQSQLNQHNAIKSHAKASLGNATANAMMGLKPSYNKAGSLSSSTSLMAVKQPYLYLTTPKQCIPYEYEHYAGFPANITDTLKNFEGFTVVSDIRLNGLVATSPEVAEINELLHSGVII